MEVKSSPLFQSLNVKKYPAEIIRRKDIDPNLMKKRRRRNQDKKKDEVKDDGIIDSEDSQEEVRKARRLRKIDYFVDRPIDGYYHICKARDIAFQRPKDTIEWSG
jgi:hypothetical protein